MSDMAILQQLRHTLPIQGVKLSDVAGLDPSVAFRGQRSDRFRGPERAKHPGCENFLA
jgi:hypothetical protein